MDQPHLHRLPELSQWGNILSLKGSCLTVWTKNSASLGLPSAPCPSLGLLPSHCFPLALSLPPHARGPACFPPRHRGLVPHRSSAKTACPFSVSTLHFPREERGIHLVLGLTFPVLSQPSVTPLFLSLHGGLISHLTVLGDGKPSSYFI